MKFQWKENRFWQGLIVPIALFLCFLLFFSLGVKKLSASSEEESLKILQDALLRATVQCYAIEGMYPPNVAYLEENYGVSINHDKYVVHYEVFASNILPGITVIKLK